MNKIDFINIKPKRSKRGFWPIPGIYVAKHDGLLEIIFQYLKGVLTISIFFE